MKATVRTYINKSRGYAIDSFDQWKCPNCGVKNIWDNKDKQECWFCKQLVELNYRRIHRKTF